MNLCLFVLVECQGNYLTTIWNYLRLFGKLLLVKLPFFVNLLLLNKFWHFGQVHFGQDILDIVFIYISDTVSSHLNPMIQLPVIVQSSSLMSHCCCPLDMCPSSFWRLSWYSHIHWKQWESWSQHSCLTQFLSQTQLSSLTFGFGLFLLHSWGTLCIMIHFMSFSRKIMCESL